MSKTVTIPTDGMNPFVVISNGVKYVYTPGETVTVPDGVALEIEEYKRWRDKHYGSVKEPFGAKPDLSQNDPDAADYVKGRTHYRVPMYSEHYINYFDVNPKEMGIGVYPLVLAKEGQKFAMADFLDPEFLELSALPHGGNRMELVILLTNFFKATGETGVLRFNTFLQKMEFIDDINYKCVVNSVLGLTIYAIRDLTALSDDYKDMFSENGVYLEVSKDQSTIAAGYCFNVSFKILEYKALDEKYVPSIVPRASTATVGQTIVVKSVGENGNPTEWEAADLPSSDVFIVHCGQSGDKDGSFYVSESNDEIESAIAEGKVVMLQVNKEGNFANFVGKSGLDLCFVGFVGDATDNMHFYLYRLYGDGYCLRSSIYSWT